MRIFFFFLLSLFICTSCNDEEPSVVDKYPYYFAYFEGELNGQSISLLNQSRYPLEKKQYLLANKKEFSEDGSLFQFPL